MSAATPHTIRPWPAVAGGKDPQGSDARGGREGGGSAEQGAEALRGSERE